MEKKYKVAQNLSTSTSKFFPKYSAWVNVIGNIPLLLVLLLNLSHLLYTQAYDTLILALYCLLNNMHSWHQSILQRAETSKLVSQCSASFSPVQQSTMLTVNLCPVSCSSLACLKVSPLPLSMLGMKMLIMLHNLGSHMHRPLSILQFVPRARTDWLLQQNKGGKTSPEQVL